MKGTNNIIHRRKNSQRLQHKETKFFFSVSDSVFKKVYHRNTLVWMDNKLIIGKFFLFLLYCRYKLEFKCCSHERTLQEVKWKLQDPIFKIRLCLLQAMIVYTLLAKKCIFNFVASWKVSRLCQRTVASKSEFYGSL